MKPRSRVRTPMMVDQGKARAEVERSNGRQLDMESNTQVIKVRVLSTYMMFKTMRLNEII